MFTNAGTLKESSSLKSCFYTVKVAASAGNKRKYSSALVLTRVPEKASISF
jgi:hypothetical protein